MSHYHKIIFTGPAGVGKSTAITTLDELPPVSVAHPNDVTDLYPPAATVALDYGMMSLQDGVSIHLYGTPGQERFDFMWEILTQGGLGLVLLLDNTRPDPLQDARFFTDKFRAFIEATGLVLGITRMDDNPRPSLEEHHRECERLGLKPAIFEVDVRSHADLTLLVQALLYSRAGHLEQEGRAS